VPGEALQIKINTTALPALQQAVEVSGQQELTAYYLSKADRLGAKLWEKRNILQRKEPHLGLLAHGLDSLMAIEHDFLNAYSNTVALPAWFIALEDAEILYQYADIKISAEGFNRGRLQRAVHVPANYYDFITAVPVHQPQPIFSPAYLDYLARLSSHYFYTDSLKGLDQAAKIKGLLHKELPFYDSLFAGNGLLADILKSRTLTRASARLYSQLKEYLDQEVATLNDPLIRQQASAFNQTYDKTIKSGDEAPGFILFTEADQQYRLSSFRDTLVYISFWATWCKPCIEEFPLENELVQKYAQQPVKIISICLDSEEKAWMERINASQLKTLNLFAAGNWNTSLKEKYSVQSLPHYVLIDKEGKIIQNKTVRPRDGVDSLIDLHLGLYTRLPDNR
jgi:thiol-disulfide isomerase/thioredoxin